MKIGFSRKERRGRKDIMTKRNSEISLIVKSAKRKL